MTTPGGKRLTLFVATDGDDSWSGKLAAPNAGRTDGPFGSLERARNAIREMKAKEDLKEPVTVMVRGGEYYLQETLVLGGEDSGTLDCPVTYSAYPGEKPTISGGRRIEGKWKPCRDGIMMCALPDVMAGKLRFTQLFINGKRQIRARYPDFDPTDPLKGGYINAKGHLSERHEEDAPTGMSRLQNRSEGARGILFDPKTFTARKWARPDEAIIHIFPSNL